MFVFCFHLYFSSFDRCNGVTSYMYLNHHIQNNVTDTVTLEV